jgi:uncharacterized protein YndB with AHSA1/START domain
MSIAITDRIEKQTLLRAPRARVWQAIADAEQFGAWFGAKFHGPFTPGVTLRGEIRPTTMDPEIAKGQEPYAGHPFEITIERMEPERALSFRWHPYAVDKNADYSKEPTTLITFTLEDAPNGTLLTVTESGFDRIPLERRAQAFTSNSEGWTMQMRLIEKYLAKAHHAA